MEKRQLGPTDVRITPVALGAWAIGGWMWGGTDDQAALAAIRRALDVGMTSIDTAPVYGFGHSEEIVGRAVADGRDDVQLLTKFGLRWDLEEGTRYFDTTTNDGRKVTVYKCGRAHSVVEECERSLRRLGTDRIDLYQHHWPDAATPVEETMDACAKLVKQGKVRAVGVSNYSPQQMEEARQVVPLASNQPPYSMLERGIEADVVPYCREHDVSLLVYSPLRAGLLTGKVPADREFPSDDKRSRDPDFSVENRRRVNAFLAELGPIAESHDATVTQVVLAWTIAQPGITCALAGCRRPEQSEENAGAMRFELTEAELARIDELLGGLELER